MKIVTIVGARPQFVKAAPVSNALQKAGHQQILIHTGQHYDYEMSQVFFDELGIPQPKANLNIGSGSHGIQTGRMLESIEEVLMDEKPDWTLVYGDTNSTLAGALAAAKLHIKVAHVEAGLRSFNRTMPEEINRVLTDHISSLLLCPSGVAAGQLAREGIISGVHVVGDVMYSALMLALKRTKTKSRILEHLGLEENKFILATVHRSENADNPDHLKSLLEAFIQINETVVFPVHPRTYKALQSNGLFFELGLASKSNLVIIEPVGYLDMVRLEQAARLILTDSGGIQKEAYWLKVPCITLRNETEWVETVQTGWNILAGCDVSRIVSLSNSFIPPSDWPKLYGDDTAASKIVLALENYQKS